MRSIYKVIPSESAPELILDESIREKLIGESIACLSPDKPFMGRIAEHREWTQFYRVDGCAFALSELVWDHCEELYYALRENSIEFPAVRTPSGDFAIIHPLQVLPPTDDPLHICDLTYAGSIFRIHGRPLDEVYCLAGLANPEDEIKHLYEKYGFTGLRFEKVWSEKQPGHA
jgi:hypothetical protein